MKTKMTFFLGKQALAAACLFLCPVELASAGVWHVANTGGVPRDFTSVASAIASPTVQNGDTLIISGSFAEDITLSRPLHLIGYGYFHAENGITHPPTTQLPASVRSITITAAGGAQPNGGSITGLTTNGCSVGEVDGFTVRRCSIQTLSISGDVQPAKGILVIQNYLRGHPSGYYNNGTIISQTYDNSNILIANNIILGSDEGTVRLGAGDSMVFLNNIFLPGPAGGAEADLAGTGVFANNVAYSSINGTGSYSVQNNLAIGGAHLPAGNGNLNSQVEADVFVLGPSPDARYKLKAGSPALGAGTEGSNIGAYGGHYPYVTSGLPPLPVITNISAPLSAADGQPLRVQIRVEVAP